MAGSGGGGIDNAAGTLSLTNVFVFSNSAADGGGIANAGNMTISIVTFAGDNASNDGGGIYNTGTASIADVTFGSRLAQCFSARRFRRFQGWRRFTTWEHLTLINSTIAGDSSSRGRRHL